MYYLADCHSALGLADGRIKDSQITAYSIYGNNRTLYGPARARLNNTGGYRAQPGSKNAIISVLFREAMIITEIATQGYYGRNIQEWTKGYYLGYTIGAVTDFFKEKSSNQVKVKEKN